MKRGMFRSLRVESLSLRALMAADVVVAEDFNDGNANDFTSDYSGAQSAGVVDSNSSHGKVFQIDNVRVVVDSAVSPTTPPQQPVDAVRVETVDGERVMLIDGTNSNDSLNVVVKKGQA